jgi:hypothetical protein
LIERLTRLVARALNHREACALRVGDERDPPDVRNVEGAMD